MRKQRTTESFIEESKNIYGVDTYKYDQTIFTTVHNKVKIYCNHHKKYFEVRPSKHLKGAGCQLCAYKKRSDMKLKDKEYFIKKSKAVHGDLYDYTDTVYTKANTLVTIKCNTCLQYFEQIASTHSSGAGCSKCEHNRGMDRQRNTTEIFINKAKKKYKEEFSYVHTKYGINNREKVLVTCNNCLVTSQVIPSNFLHGSRPSCNCPKHYGFKEHLPGILYYLEINNGEAFKIGITNKTVEQRYHNYDLKKIKTIKTWSFEKGADARKLETLILRKFKKYKYYGKPLLSAGNSELFTQDILSLDESFFSETNIFY